MPADFTLLIQGTVKEATGGEGANVPHTSPGAPGPAPAGPFMTGAHGPDTHTVACLLGS